VTLLVDFLRLPRDLAVSIPSLPGSTRARTRTCTHTRTQNATSISTSISISRISIGIGISSGGGGGSSSSSSVGKNNQPIHIDEEPSKQRKPLQGPQAGLSLRTDKA
jgi:hypothetical protein